MAENPYKVKLISVANTGTRVEFDNTPTLSEGRTVEYSSVAPVHMPGSIQVYKRTNHRIFGLTAKFISRTSEEATINKRKLQRLRAWMMPFFGSGSSTLTAAQQTNRAEATSLRQKLGQPQPQNNSTSSPNNIESVTAQASAFDTGIEMLGSPPEILYLYGYSSTAQDARSSGIPNINRIPVVIASIDFTYPDDVDYIATTDASLDPFPVRMEITLSLLETHSPTEYARFNLQQFKNGQLVNF